jgi:hypothetical protein
MKFMKLDTPSSSSSSSSTSTSKPSIKGDDGEYMYLDEMLDKTFLTDYFLV